MEPKKIIIIALIAVAAIVAFFVFTAKPAQVIDPATGLPYPPNVINPATGAPYNPAPGYPASPPATTTTTTALGVDITVPNSNLGVDATQPFRQPTASETKYKADRYACHAKGGVMSLSGTGYSCSK